MSVQSQKIAIIALDGKQIKVEEGMKLFLDSRSVQLGDKLDAKEVLLLQQGTKTLVGQPYITGASVTMKVVQEEVKADKVIVFKKKRRKGYRVKRGHRQPHIQVSVVSIQGPK